MGDDLRAKVWCHVCRTFVSFVDDGKKVTYFEHRCCTCTNCTGKCCRSGKEVDASQIPSWHPHHVCGWGCDGQDGFSSQCAKEKAKGPPDAITRLGGLS